MRNCLGEVQCSGAVRIRRSVILSIVSYNIRCRSSSSGVDTGLLSSNNISVYKTPVRLMLPDGIYPQASNAPPRCLAEFLKAYMESMFISEPSDAAITPGNGNTEKTARISVVLCLVCSWQSYQWLFLHDALWSKLTVALFTCCSPCLSYLFKILPWYALTRSQNVCY